MVKVGEVKLNTGVSMPRFGYGTWQILFGVRKKVINAIETGYRLIDTAKIYGNEVGVGAAIRESKVDRSDIFLTTKLWTNEQGRLSTKPAFDESLKRLGLEYIDLYLIHWPGHDPVRRRESWQVLEELYDEEFAKAIGVSNYHVDHLEELQTYAKVLPAVNQIEFHPYIYEDQLPVLDWCRDRGIIVEAYSPLAHGRHAKDPIVAAIAQAHNATSAQIMLAWCLHHGTVPIPKTTDPDRMKQNLDSINIKLTGEEVNKLNSLSRGESTIRGRH